MNIQAWLLLFTEQIQQTSLAEWGAVAFGIAEVLLARKNNILLYPAGIISTVLSVWLLLKVSLYAEALLNVYYLVMSIYGWLHWIRSSNNAPLPVTFTGKKEWQVVATIVAAGWLALYLVLKRFTNSTYPSCDAFVSAAAWAGMWLLARRKVENWLLLNLSNLFAVPLLFIKQLPLMACLTMFLFIIAVSGYFDWRRKARELCYKQQ